MKKKKTRRKETEIVFKSDIWYLPLTSVLFANLFVVLFHGINMTFQLIMLIILIAIFICLKQFKFYENYFCCVNVFRPRFLFREKCYSYEEIYMVEIRKLNKPYNRPYVIFHFTEKQVKSKMLPLSRYFLYSDARKLYPLLKIIKEKKVPIKLNISYEYNEDKRFFEQFLS